MAWVVCMSYKKDQGPNYLQGRRSVFANSHPALTDWLDKKLSYTVFRVYFHSKDVYLRILSRSYYCYTASTQQLSTLTWKNVIRVLLPQFKTKYSFQLFPYHSLMILNPTGDRALSYKGETSPLAF
jgi:hypothetical protein